jgi:Uma2 family endonuclease
MMGQPMTKAKIRCTPEELLAMPDGDNYELVDGFLVKRNPGARASYVGGQTFAILRNFCRANHLGWVFPAGASYCCFPDAPGTVRKPNASLVRMGRFPGEMVPEGHILIAPDLAVEVLSPSDTVYAVDQRVEEYRRAGVRLVWVINPKTQTVRVYRADGSGIILGAANELTGEDVLPGFRCRVADLFRTPAAQQA